MVPSVFSDVIFDGPIGVLWCYCWWSHRCSLMLFLMVPSVFSDVIVDGPIGVLWCYCWWSHRCSLMLLLMVPSVFSDVIVDGPIGVLWCLFMFSEGTFPQEHCLVQANNRVLFCHCQYFCYSVDSRYGNNTEIYFYSWIHTSMVWWIFVGFILNNI
jgi:hypothetical protein